MTFFIIYLFSFLVLNFLLFMKIHLFFFRISLPPHKVQKTKTIISETIALGESGNSVECKSLAKVTGLLAHALFSHGNFTKIVSRKVLKKKKKKITYIDNKFIFSFVTNIHIFIFNNTCVGTQIIS